MSIIDSCRSAWNGTKKAHQPDYYDLIESYRDMLTARAEAVLATSLVDDGPFAAFEQAVLNAPPEPAVSSDQGYEQVTDEPFYDEPIHLESQGEAVIAPDEPSDPKVTGTIEVAHEAKSATVNVTATEPPIKKKPLRKVAVVVKKSASKSPAKKPASKPKVIKKGKK